MAAGGNPANVDLGPGRLYYAPIGTTEPTDCSTALPSAWVVVGYTEEGTEIATEITSEMIEVAEELDPIAYEQTRRTTKVTFSMAETTKRRLGLALGTGGSETDNAASFEFPDAGTTVAVMFVWDSDDVPSATNKRWLFRKCTPTGTVSTARRKAPQKALIPVTFDCAKPSTAVRSVKVFPNSSGQI